MNFSRSFTFVAALAALGSAQAGWNRSPHAETRPVDLAASAIPGTQLLSSAGLGNAQALISSNIDEGVTLAAGKSSAVIQLAGQQNIHTAAFNNDGAEGKVTIAGSMDNKDWSVLGRAVFSAGERVAQIYFATATVKYINVSFDSAKGGTIRSFEVFGESTDRDYTLQPRNTGEGGSTINLADAVGGARAIYAFPTATNVGELNPLHNVFNFPRSRDKYCTIVYDLGSTRTVEHFAASYSRRPMRVEVFALQGLSEKRDWRGKLTIDPAVFNSLKPIAIGEDAKGVGHMRITPDIAISATHIALRFEQDYQNEVALSPAAGFGLLPESRFTKGLGVGSDDLIIGSVEFQSAGEFGIARNRARTNGIGTPDPHISSALGYSASMFPRGLSSQPTVANLNTRNDNIRRDTKASSDTKADTTDTKLTVAAPVIGQKTETAPDAPPYIAGEAGSAESKLVKSFSTKFDAGASKKNKHGRNCDHCYYCNRGGRCKRCGGHDDDHDNDGDGDDDDDGGDDDDDDDGDHDDHDDHGPPMTLP